MSASHTLAYDARRRALLSSYSPKLSDASQFPISAILAKLPTLPPLSPAFDVPGQLDSPIPPTSPTPDIAPPPLVPTTGSPAVNGLGIDNSDDDLPQAQDSDSGGPQPQAAGGLRRAFKTQPRNDLDASDASDDDDNRKKSDKKKRFLGSRSIAWWTRFSKRG